MQIIPAIDLKGGQCVRLRQGRAEDVTVYSTDPIAMARHWVDEGARYLHVVDLDGAFEGRPVQAALIESIVKAVAIPVEVGGGLRTDEDVRRLLDCGADRAIIGTRAISDRDAIGRLAAAHGARFAVGIDARDGRVQVRGWVETTHVDAYDLGRDLAALGVRTLIYTDTSSDGMMQGANVAAMARMCRGVSCNVIASGGVTTAADIEALRSLREPRLIGAIVGKALYEGRLRLRDVAAD